MRVRVDGKFDIECGFCGETFQVNANRKDKARFCSAPCTHAYQKQKAWGVLIKKGQRISQATEIKGGQRLSPKTEFKKGQAPWNKGLKTGSLSDKHRAKIGNAHRGMKRTETTRRNISMGLRDLSPSAKQRRSENISKGLTGKTFSEARKQRQSVARKGQHRSPRTEFEKGMIPWNKGKTFPPETHSNWQGGKSFEPYPTKWTKMLKESIRERDGQVCQICGNPEPIPGRKLCVHHIDYDKANLDPDNLISLCAKHHSETNYNRKKWKEYFRVLQIHKIGLTNTG